VLVADVLEAHGIPTVARDVRVAAFDRLELPMTVPLPMMTQILIRISNLCAGYWWLMLIIAARPAPAAGRTRPPCR
jgi:hypothetical protein